MGFLKNWRRRQILRRFRLPGVAWRRFVESQSLLHRLNEDELARLQELVILFLHEKSLEPIGNLELDDVMRLSIAAPACLPILNLGLDYYTGWVSLIIYPESFRVQHRYIDAAGVVHYEHCARAGEAWARGPLVLSWADVVQVPTGAGYNVVIHECAHKLDMLNGVANGMPPLHGGMAIPQWTQAFTSAYEQLCQQLMEGKETVINSYAAQSPGEFFAVVSEAFFTIPGVLHDVYPAVYQQLCAFYRQDPAVRLP